MRIPMKEGTKGSLKWVQRLLNDPASTLNRAIHDALAMPQNVLVEWRSPRPADRHAEYRDGEFLELLGLDRLKDDLKAYWPDRGPQWDALGVAPIGKVVLVEAKAHVAEMASDCAAGPASRKRIEETLGAARKSFGARDNADWTKGFYQ